MMKIPKTTRKAVNTQKKMPTSTPFKSKNQPQFNVSNISAISGDSSGSKSDKSKESAKNTQDTLDMAYNIYLLALSTTKMQEEKLSALTAKNEDQNVALLSEIEKKRSYLASLEEMEVGCLADAASSISTQREVLTPVIDDISKVNVEVLKHSVEQPLHLRGFLPETSPEVVKEAVVSLNASLERTLPADHKVWSETAAVVETLANNVSNVVEAQNRYKESANQMSSTALEEFTLNNVYVRRAKKDSVHGFV